VRAVLAILLPDFGYRLMALLHIAAAVAAFGPLFLYPSLRRNGETQTMAAMHMRLSFPALVMLWVLGMGLAGMSDQVYKMSQLWLALSLVNWVVLIAVSWFLIRPAVSDASDAASVRLSYGVAVTHLGLIVGLVLMIWKPGF
jgi:hypothetical protein